MRGLFMVFMVWFLVPFISLAQESLFDRLPPPQPQPRPVVRSRPPVTPSPLPEELQQAQEDARRIDSLEVENARLRAAQTAQADTSYSVKRLWADWEANEKDNRDNYLLAKRVSFWIIALWLAIVAGLLIYLFARFQFYGGLRRKRYIELLEKIKKDDTIPWDEKAEHYPQNPYKGETLGLPKGTVRGLLTLTLLVANCLVLYVSTHSPPGSHFRENTEFITTAFLMMIAFYFGSKAVDVFKAREETRRKATPEGDAEPPALAGAPVPARAGAPAAPVPPVHFRPTTTPKKDFKHEGSTTVKIADSAGAPGVSLDERILALTAYFETGKKIDQACSIVAGDFDGMGISFGCLQWNLGQQTLQPILRNYFQFGDGAWKGDANMEELAEVLERPLKAQLEWARSIQQRSGNKHVLLGEWKKTFTELGPKTKRFQLQATERRFKIARGWCRELALISERALALMFDINVQNGTLFKVSQKRNINVRRSINERIANAGTPSEERKLVIIAEERARASNPRWVHDVLARKLAIARGHGKVHGATVNLDDFDIRIDRHFE